MTQQIPFELVDDALERTRSQQERLRLLPWRVGVYFVLGLALFSRLGYLRVWDKLTAGLGQFPLRRPSEKALRDLRRRLGPAPLKLLFTILAGPVARPATPGTCYRCWRTVAFDGCSSAKAPDRLRVCGWLGKIKHRYGQKGSPMLKLVTLCKTGTRALLGATFGPVMPAETAYAQQLLPLLDKTMLLLGDRGFDSDEFLTHSAGTGTQLLVRWKSRRTPAKWAHLPDGSSLTRIRGVGLRVIDAEVTARTTSGVGVTGHYRLATTLLDHHRYPATELVTLYHERWEIESAFYALRHTLLGGLVLRSPKPRSLQQEMWAQLMLYQALRRTMAEAAESHPGVDPDRAAFTAAVEAARDQVITAGGVQPDPVPDRHVGPLGQAALANRLPPRRPCLAPRKVTCPISRYANPSDQKRILTTARITDITIHSGLEPAVQGRRDRTVQIMRTAPDHAGTPARSPQS